MSVGWRKMNGKWRGVERREKSLQYGIEKHGQKFWVYKMRGAEADKVVATEASLDSAKRAASKDAERRLASPPWEAAKRPKAKAGARLSTYEQRVLADMMAGSGIWFPGTSGTAKSAARNLVRGGYIRREDDPHEKRTQYVISPRGRDFVLSQIEVPGSAVQKRWAEGRRRRVRGKRSVRAPAAKQSEKAALSAALRRDR